MNSSCGIRNGVLNPAIQQCCLLVLLAFPALSYSADHTSDWSVVMRHYRPYVTVENVAKMYGFKSTEVRSGHVYLKSPGVVLKAKLGGREFTINGLRYELLYAIEAKGSTAIVSVADLRGLMDLVFRPTSHMQPSPVTQVLVENASGEGVANADVFIEMLREYMREEKVQVRVGATSGPWGVTLPGQRVTMKERLSGGLGGSVMIRVVAGAKGLAKDEVRSVILAPAGAPLHISDSSTKGEQVVYAGNLYDAENLALATLIQGKIVSGAGGKDAGIRFGGNKELRSAHYPVVQLEPGAELDFTKIARLTADGIKRYVEFISAELKKREEQERVSKALLKIEEVELYSVVDEDSLAGGEAEALKSGKDIRRLRLILPIARRDGNEESEDKKDAKENKTDKEAEGGKKKSQSKAINPSQVDIQVFFFDLADREKVHLIQSEPPEVRWLSILPDWTIDQPEVLDFLYDVPPQLEGGEIKPERDLGYVIRVVYKGELQDAVAQPKGLLNQLWNFTPIFPK